MKAVLSSILLLAVAVLVCGCASVAPAQQTGAAATAPPNLVGNWSGTATGYLAGTGFTSYSGGSMIMSITEQKERIFEGRFIYPNMSGSMKTVNFAGAIGRDGRTLTIAEESGGYSSGTLVGPNEIELIFADDTQPIEVAIDTLRRT